IRSGLALENRVDLVVIPSLDVDAELASHFADILFVFPDGDFLRILRYNTHIEGEALELLDQHLERLGHAGLRYVLTLYDGFVRLDPADHIVRLDGEHLLKCIRRSVGLQSPHLHLAETLPAEL